MSRTPIKRNITSGQVSVGTTATQVVPENKHRLQVHIRNTHATEAVFLGNAAVTTANGYQLPAGAEFVDREGTGAWYAIKAATTATLSYTEVA